MAKLGRPSVYQSDAEKPVTVSLRIPRDVYEQARRYVSRRPPLTLTDLLLDGLRLRLETPADPRDVILSDDNTVMQELQEMVDAAVQKALAKGSTAPPALDTAKRALAPEVPAQPVPDIAHDDNTVLQKNAARRPGRPSTLRQPIVDLLHAHPEGLTAVQIKVHLGVDKNIGDTLAGMVRNRLLEKQGSGNAVRYRARTTL
jgi:hypothetical protein